jgi:hypothetical protein
MRSNTGSRHSVISLFEEDNTPTTIWTATWLTVGLLVLMLVLGALFLSGFFSSIAGGIGHNPVQTDTRAQP